MLETKIRNILLTILVMCMFIFAYHRIMGPQLRENPSMVRKEGRKVERSLKIDVEIFLVVG